MNALSDYSSSRTNAWYLMALARGIAMPDFELNDLGGEHGQPRDVDQRTAPVVVMA